MAIQSLHDKEEELARQLQDVCTPFGDERKSKLSESTKLLYCIGCIYLRKVEVTQSMEQKLNFIKAATLLHGARVRSEKFLKNRWKTEIRSALTEMETLLIEKCLGDLPVPLSEISFQVKSAFESYRSDEKKCLHSLAVIPDGIPEDAAARKRKDKVKIVREMMKNNSENYKKEMQRITNYCLEVLGPEPCQFAIVGLGSLARDEVTLYSDFEHIILLEEGVQDREEYEEILEYFRWFSVVFHVTVIGVGETLIRSVGVDSMNDFYSTDKSRNWFYDSFTPSGVSFDGMMPHACKIPIGRQIATGKKDFVVELIKPVSQMALYLTKEEDVINEYCLKDVLSETCFVFGLEALFYEFKEKADRILAQESDRDSFSSLSEAAAENRNIHVRKFGLLSEETVDPKSEFYRPLSVFIGYAARVQGLVGKSGFDKVSQLKNIMLSKDTRSLEWAFAVACEIRLKSYDANSGNRVRQGRDTLEYVGVACLINCASAISDLCLHFKAMSHPTEFGKFLGAKLSVLLFVEKFGEAKEEISHLMRQPDFMESFSFLIILYKQILSRIYIVESISYPESQRCLLEKAESVILDIVDYRRYCRTCLVLSSIYCRQGRYEEAKELADAAFEKLHHDGFTPERMMEVQEAQLRAARGCMSVANFIDYCISFLTKNQDLVSKLQFGYAIGKAKCEVSEKDEARLIFKRVVELWATRGLKSISRMKCMIAISAITSQQFSEGWFADCVETYEVFEDIFQPGRDAFDFELLKRHQVECYLQASGNSLSVKEKIGLCQKAVSICTQYLHLETFNDLYCFALTLISEYSVSHTVREFDALALYDIFAGVPPRVRDDINVKATVGRGFIKMHAVLYQSKVGPLVIWHNVRYIWQMTKTPHPYVYPFLRDLLIKVYMKLHEMFGRPLDLDGILSYYRAKDFSILINFYWKSLFVRKHMLKKTIRVFLSRVNRLLCVNAYHLFYDLVDQLPHQLSPNMDFTNAVFSYFMYNFESAIGTFWSIICKEDKNSHLQRLSITFLCNSVIQFLVEKCGFQFYHDYSKHQLSAGPREVVQRLKPHHMTDIGATPMSRRTFGIPEKVNTEIEIHKKERFVLSRDCYSTQYEHTPNAGSKTEKL